MGDMSIAHYIFNAGFVVTMVMLLLVLASVLSWGIIVERFRLLRQAKLESDEFAQVYQRMNSISDMQRSVVGSSSDLSKILRVGFKHISSSAVDSDKNKQRARAEMEIERDNLIQRRSRNVTWLATIASTSPYVGLLGTVWGIVTAFMSLHKVKQATIAMVAPGISEALIATAMGLFVAIPAVIAYNRLSQRVNELDESYTRMITRFVLDSDGVS